MRSRLSVLVAASALAALVLSGCTGEPAPVVTTPGFASEEEAFAAAELTYRNYVDALNQVDLSDPATFEAVYSWTTGDLNAADRKQFTQMHADNWRLGGTRDLEVSEPQEYDRASMEVTLAVCIDVGLIQITDASGQSQVSPDRVDLQSTSVTVEGNQSTASGWAVSRIVSRQGLPECGT